jgi:hypothetical protein
VNRESYECDGTKRANEVGAGQIHCDICDANMFSNRNGVFGASTAGIGTALWD